MKTHGCKGSSYLASAIVWLAIFLCIRCSAAERVLWQLGKFDKSEQEFGVGVRPDMPQLFELQLGSGTETNWWPRFHPGSGNAAFGAQPYRYVVWFELGPAVPSGVLYLDLSLLFRQPREPSLELVVNGRPGRFYFRPEPMLELGNWDDQFNPIRSVARRRIALPAAFFKPGLNRFEFVALDEPQTVVSNRTVGGSGDSGFFYDAIALGHDPTASIPDTFEAVLEPTGLYPRTPAGVKQECNLFVRLPVSCSGGVVKMTVGKFATELKLTNPVAFGESRYTILLPANVEGADFKIEFLGTGTPDKNWSQTCTGRFSPARRWTVFYAPSMHLDIGYTDYRPKVAEVHARGLDDLLGVLDKHPGYRFNLDGSWIVEQWLATRSAGQVRRLTKHARAGRVGMNAFYASFYTDYPSYETFARNLYLAKQLERQCGIPFDFTLITDIPGNSWSVPSVLASAGIRYFACAANQDRGPILVLGRWHLRSPFWWEGPDGKRVLSWYSSHYHQLKAVAGLPPTIESCRSGLPRFLAMYERAGYKPDAVLLYGTEVENLPLDFDDVDFVDRWNRAYAYPRIVPCRFSEFFRYIEQRYGAELPVVRGEAGPYWADSVTGFPWATARDRLNQVRAVTAEVLASLTAALKPQLRYPHELGRAIWRNILLYSEHSYGSHRTGSQPEHDETIGQLKEKEDQVTRAESDIQKLMRHALSQLADQIQVESPSLIVFNPLSWTHSAPVRVMVNEGTVLIDAATGRLVPYEVLERKHGALTIRFWAEDVPAIGYRVYRLERGQDAAGIRVQLDSTAAVVENRFYRITLDPDRAAIKGVLDKELGCDLVDPASEYRLGECLFVSGGDNSQLLRPLHWLPTPQLAVHRTEGGTVLGIERTPLGQRVRMRGHAYRTPRIETEIFLPDAVKQIELRNVIEVELGYTKQASYFAFPFALRPATFRFNIANGFVNPATDLLEGACNETLMVQDVVNVSDGRAAVDLAVVDSPLVCLGDIVRGRWPRWFTNDTPAVFSLVLNNFWSSKWMGKKSVELVCQYALTSRRRFDPVASTRFGLQTRTPLEVCELKPSDKSARKLGVLPGTAASLVTLLPTNLVLTACKAAEDGDGLVVRIRETAGRPTGGMLKLPFLAVMSAHEANLVEMRQRPLPYERHVVRFSLGPNDVVTAELRVQPELEVGSQ